MTRQVVDGMAAYYAANGGVAVVEQKLAEFVEDAMYGRASNVSYEGSSGAINYSMKPEEAAHFMALVKAKMLGTPIEDEVVGSFRRRPIET